MELYQKRALMQDTGCQHEFGYRKTRKLKRNWGPLQSPVTPKVSNRKYQTQQTGPLQRNNVTQRTAQ